MLRTPRPWLLLCVLFLSFAPGAAAARYPAQPAVLPILAAVGDAEGSTALWTLDAQVHGKAASLITAPPGSTLDQPVRSPNGLSLAYVVDGRALWQTDAEGHGARLLYALPTSTYQRISGPRYAPGSKTIGFTVGCCGNYSIYRMNTDGTALRRIQAGGVRILQDWAPDGTHILYTLNGKLWTADPYGGHASPIGNDAAVAGNFFDAHYSPDNTHITASLLLAAGANEGAGRVIVLMHDDGRYLTILTGNEPYDSTDPTWSPDGKHIAFLMASGTIGPLGRRHEVWVMRFNGKQKVDLSRSVLNNVSAIIWSR